MFGPVRRWCGALLGVITLVAGGAQASGLDANQARIELLTNLTQMQLTTEAGSSECPAGQNWDIVVNGCTNALLLGYDVVFGRCSCSCPRGYIGSCVKTRTGAVEVYGWRSPPDGAQQVSHTVELYWGPCKEASNTCVPGSPPPPGPEVGDQFTISTSALICGPSDAGYNAVAIDDGYKNQLISYYRGMGIAGRCPELSGFSYWLNQWKAGAQARAVETFDAAGEGADWGKHLASGHDWYWKWHLKKAIDTSANSNDESGQGGVDAADSSCQSTANRLFGSGKVSAVYILKSGNRCRITAVN